MPKPRTEFVCQQCGYSSPRGMGRCPRCNAWNAMVEQIPAVPAPASAAGPVVSKPKRLREVEGGEESRLPLPIEEFSRVLGGGVVPGSIVLIGGDPGIGKSTLLLQASWKLAGSSGPVLYVSGEESERQMKMRAVRLAGGAADRPAGKAGRAAAAEAYPESLFLVTETRLDAILQHVQDLAPRILIIDSIQTAYLPELTSSAGSVSQVRECASRLQALAKSSGIAVFLIGHVTKEGVLAGPRVLEHIVDTVLYLEGDRFQSYRLLRAVKNRFGAVSEVGVFEMRGDGLVEVPNPSEAFLAERAAQSPGSAIAVVMEGTRPLLLELQGLTSPAAYGTPRRTPNGVDLYRLLLVSAVLTRRAGVRVAEEDVFLNVIGGLRVSEPAADLAMAAAIASSVKDRPVAADAVLIGEVGLSGELRAVSQTQTRLREATALGFRRAILPRTVRRGEPPPSGIDIVGCRSLREALEAALVAP
ncbi:MAG: DNA repair protein RadA [Anaerolineales bacterium]|nr:DNA repair protein RadA [Anaerolineales bacterium]